MNFPPHFRSLHSSLFIAFHYLPSPFIAFYRLSSSFITFHRRPISLSAHSLLSPVLSSPRPVLSSPRPALSPCPRIPPLHTCFPPASSPPLFHTSVFHAPLSALLCFASLFCSLCFTPSIVFTLSHCFTSFVLFLPPLLYSLPLFYTALLYSLPLFYTALLYSLPLFTPLCFTLSHCLHPLRFIYSHCFAPVFLLPGNLRKPRHRKRQRFSHFSKKFCKKPLTKQKKVLY